MVVALTAGVAVIGAVDHRASFAGYFLLAAGLGLINPAIIGYLNERVPASVRATVLSVSPLGTSLAFALAGGFAGVLADASLRLAFVVLAATVLAVAGGAYLLWLRADAAMPAAPAALATVAANDAGAGRTPEPRAVDTAVEVQTAE